MADKKISQLTAASTPLAGTEVLPIVQSGATVKVSVANLTAGRAVDVLSLSASSTIAANYSIYAKAELQGISITDAQTLYRGTPDGIGFEHTKIVGARDASTYTYGSQLDFYTEGKNSGTTDTSTVKWTLDSLGNLIQKVAAKGINFTANTPAAGMTSQLLNWYEEGTWTPAQGSGLTVVGAFSSSGTYTRIGRQVTVSGTVTGATSVAVAAAGIVTTNLPFTVVTAGHGNATNAAVNASAAVICTTTNVTSANAIAATGTITFSATYFV